MLENIERVGEKLTDTRRVGFDLKFNLTDVLGAIYADLHKKVVIVGNEVDKEDDT